MNAKVAALQTVLGVTVDGIWGPESQAALDRAIRPTAVTEPIRFANSNDANVYLKYYNKFRGEGMSHDEAHIKTCEKI